MQLAYNDAEETTEYGACGIAILLMRELTDLTVMQRSVKGGGFDYWLGDATDTFPFARKARLEVSGICVGDNSVIRARVNEKVRQTQTVPSAFPVYVVVIGFSNPKAQVEKR